MSLLVCELDFNLCRFRQRPSDQPGHGNRKADSELAESNCLGVVLDDRVVGHENARSDVTRLVRRWSGHRYRNRRRDSGVEARVRQAGTGVVASVGYRLTGTGVGRDTDTAASRNPESTKSIVAPGSSCSAPRTGKVDDNQESALLER